MLNQNIESIYQTTNNAIENFNRIDRDQSGSLSRKELEADTANAFLAERTKDIAQLHDGFFEFDKEIKIEDLEKLKTLTFNMALDSKHFQNAKDYFVENHDKLDQNGDGKVTGAEVSRYKNTYKISGEELMTLDYLSKRMSGNYSNEFQDTENKVRSCNDKYFASSWNLGDLSGMTVKDRITQSQKEVMSADMIEDWEFGGKVAGLSLGALVAPASGPGSIAIPAAGYVVGGSIGRRIGTRAGLMRVDGYYSRNHEDRIERIFKGI